MPKLRKSPYGKPQAPPIDWLWAAVLERKKVYNYDLKMMAQVCGVSYQSMRNYSMVSPWRWPPDVRERICDEFGIRVTLSPDGDMLRGAIS